MKKFLFIVTLVVMFTACDNYEKTALSQDDVLVMLSDSETGLKGLEVGPAGENSGNELLPVEYESISLLDASSPSYVVLATKQGMNTLYSYEDVLSEWREVVTAPTENMTVIDAKYTANGSVIVVNGSNKDHVYSLGVLYKTFDNVTTLPETGLMFVEDKGVCGVLQRTSASGMLLDLRYEHIYILSKQGTTGAYYALTRKAGETRYAWVVCQRDGWRAIGFISAADMKNIVAGGTVTDKYFLTVPDDNVMLTAIQNYKRYNIHQAIQVGEY